MEKQKTLVVYKDRFLDIERLKTVEEYAKTLGISGRAVRYQIKSGAAEMIKIDGRIFVYLSDEQFQKLK